ncbi:MAG: hypothetical protein Q9205_007317 [Flavoplaca limonia]
MPRSTFATLKATKPKSSPQTTKLDVQIQTRDTKKKGRAAQQWLDKCFSKKAKTEKPKTERGETRPPKRTHHCAFCNKAFNHICKEKNHMVPCRIHPEVYSIPGTPCKTCMVEAEAEARNIKETEEGDKRLGKANKDAFFIGDKGRKKPGRKMGRASFDEDACRVD